MNPYVDFSDILFNSEYSAIAWINGNNDYHNLRGSVKFYKTGYGGVLVVTEVFRLPDDADLLRAAGNEKSGFFAMHIHENGDCTIPFDKTGNHYNPYNLEHPNHAGDLPPLLSNNGYAFLVVYDERFSIEDIIGKSVIIHRNADDFMTQPSGNSGNKIGCGVIRRND